MLVVCKSLRIIIYLWFTGLTLLISVFRDRIDAVFLRRVNIVCGGVIVFYGVKLLLGFWELV